MLALPETEAAIVSGNAALRGRSETVSPAYACGGSGARMRPERAANRVQTPSGCRHSDKEKFPSDLNGPKSCKMSERLLKTLRQSGDFQAEYRLPPTLSGCSSRCFE